MKTRVVRTAITELDESEAYDLTQFIRAATSNPDDYTRPAPTEKQIAVAALFAAQMEETLG